LLFLIILFKIKIIVLLLNSSVLREAYKIVGHNDFFEWIVVIPLKQFSKERKQEYVNYISSLEITHKTYKPKMEKAMIHLK